MKKQLVMNLQHFADILEVFTKKDILDYTRNRAYPEMLGDTLFPSRKTQSLELDQINAGSMTPVIASVSAFDSEAEIGSREASAQTLELALIKRKMQIKEKDLIALQNPRTPQEGEYLQGRVYNDIDTLVQGVQARAEKMTMEMLSTGKITIKGNGLDANLDYSVDKKHQATLSGVESWTNDASDPIKNLENWSDSLDVAPTRVLTSNKILRIFMRHPKVIAAIFGKDSGRTIGMADLDSFMQAHGLPVIRTYDNKYKTQDKNGKYISERYFPENSFVMMNDDLLGEKVWGPTPEEIALTGAGDIESSMIGNVYAGIYRSTIDPVGTWTKASGLMIPSFAAVDEVFQATIDLTK